MELGNIFFIPAFVTLVSCLFLHALDEMELLIAIENADIDKVISYLDDYPNNVNYQNDEGYTPIMIASFQNRKDIVVLLLDHGANADMPDLYGWSPLLLCAGT